MVSATTGDSGDSSPPAEDQGPIRSAPTSSGCLSSRHRRSGPLPWDPGRAPSDGRFRHLPGPGAQSEPTSHTRHRVVGASCGAYGQRSGGLVGSWGMPDRSPRRTRSRPRPSPTWPGSSSRTTTSTLTLTHICELAVKTVEGCEAAGISIAQGTRVTSRTDHRPPALRRRQDPVRDPAGPVRRRHQGAQGVHHRLPGPRRSGGPSSPSGRTRKRESKSILSLRLFAREDTMGALNLDSREPDAFDDQDVAVGSVFAAHAAVALATAKYDEQLESKSQSRDLIGDGQGDHHRPPERLRGRGLRHPPPGFPAHEREAAGVGRGGSCTRKLGRSPSRTPARPRSPR